MASHLIPVHDGSSVWNSKLADGFLDFINERIQIITSEIEKIAGIILFEKFDYLKRL
jgi:hypothetical protein